MTDYTVEDTIYKMFTTRAFGTGIPTVLAGTPVVSAYENDSAVQITAGITLGVSHDSVVGMNLLTIVATGANGYEAGKDYNLVITTGTVDSVSVVGEVVGTFSLGRGAAFTRIGAAGASLTAINLPDQTMNITGNITGNVSGSVGSLTGHTVQTGDSFARIGAAGAALTNINLPNQTMDIVGNITGNLTGSVGSVTGLTASNLDATVSSRMATTHLDATAGKLDGVALADALTTLTGHTNQTGDTFALANGASGFAAVDGKIDGIQGAGFVTGTDSLEAIRDRGDAAWTTGAGGSDRLLMVDTTIATLASQVSFTLAAGSADDDAYNNCTIVIEDVSTATQKAVGMVLDYTGASKTVTLKEALPFVIATTDKVYILAENALKSTIANRQLDVTANGAAGIDWANVENPTTVLDLANTDINLVDTTTINTDMRGTDSAALATVATEARLSELDAATAGKMAFVVDALDTLTKAAASGDLAAIKTAADAIQVITDQFVFTKANEVDANAKSINGAAVVGDGNGVPWDGA